jgi:predicted DNA-binding protein (UPF0251 family)
MEVERLTTNSAQMLGLETQVEFYIAECRAVEPFPKHWYGTAMEDLTEIKQTTLALARAIALEGVQRKVITRREAAQALGVHPLTISRWLTAAETSQLPDQEHHPAT